MGEKTAAEIAWMEFWRPGNFEFTDENEATQQRWKEVAAAVSAPLLKRIEELEREKKILELKTSTSLANNLCPDHRDKQAGKPCLACRVEQLESELRRRGLNDLHEEMKYLSQ